MRRISLISNNNTVKNMKNDFIPQRDTLPAQRAVVNYRPNGSIEPIRRAEGGTIIRPSERVISMPTVQAVEAPEEQTIVVKKTSKPTSVAIESTKVPVRITRRPRIVKTTPASQQIVHPAYRSHEIDELFLKITAIEAEGSTGSPSSVLKTVSTPSPKKSFRVPRYMFAVLAAALVLAGAGYASVDTFLTNKQVKEVATQRAGEPAVAGASSQAIPAEGGDESDVTPSAIDAYTVAADQPRVLTIESIGVRARILPMSVNADGAMQAPVNIFDSGWFGGSAKPGTPGAAVIDAHASGATREGLFAYLDTLSKGDRVGVEQGDGTKLIYEVTHTETVALDALDMAKLMRTHNDVAEGLNLITCTGKWLADKKTYDQRVIVYTKRV